MQKEQVGLGAVDFNAADLTRIAKDQVKVLKVGAIPWIADGKAKLSIVCGGTYSNKTARSGRWRQPDGSVRESSRRYTQHSVWNKDPSAFGKLQFVE